MAIPKLQEPTISREVGRPEGNFRGGEVVGRAIQGAAEGLNKVINVSSQISADLERQRERAEIAEFGDKAARQFKMNANKFIIDSNGQAFGTDHRDFRKNVEGFLGEESERMVLNAPSPKAREFALSKIKPFVNSKIINSDSYENLRRAEFYQADRAQSIEDTAIQFFDNPNPFDASADLDALQVELSRSTHFDEKSRFGLLKEAQTKYRQNVFDGMLRDGLPGIISESMSREQKLSNINEFVSGKIEGTESLFADISDKESRNMKIRAESLVDRQEATRNSETTILINNSVNLLESETNLTPNMRNQINQAANRSGALPEGIRKENLEKSLLNARKINDLLKRSVYLTNSDLAKIDVDDVIRDDNLITSGTDKKAQNSVTQAITGLVKVRNEDGAAWVQKHYPNQSASPEKSLAIQKGLGIPKPRVLSKDESMGASRGILEGITSQDKALELDRFLALHGEFGNKAVAELMEDNKDFSEEYLIASYLDSTISKESIISNIGNGKSIATEFKIVHPGMDSVLQTEIQKQMVDVSKVFANSGITSLTSSFRKAITTESKKIMLGTPGTDSDDAVKLAATKILHENFEFVSDGKTNLIIPRDLRVSKKTIDAFLQDSLSSEAIKGFGVSKERYLFPGSQEEFAEVLKERSFWVTNEAQDGVILLATNPKTGIDGRVTNENGNPIEMKYTDMKTDQRTLDNLNFGFLTPIRNQIKKEAK